ncbi:MAG: 2-(1,2-epoxy-1,2-dihydrophenyl)acetyl-CoA isomerase PaaG [Flavobacteriales bacterium]|nr:2-(1,2-epoxy-1,2-dihydrophenyl)acetyl-CoA isomerase PaaG [Flavobacteriales bacterium]
MSHIEINIEDQVCIIKLNRPEVFNSFNKEMAFELQEILDNCEKNAAVRSILLTGEGKAFCAGQDLQELTAPDGPKLSDIVREHYNPIIKRMRSIEKPIVCAVNGVAAGAGANIALACDITIAGESVAFIQAFSKIGLIPDSGGTFFLPRSIGMQKSTALMMLADKVMAADAEKMGMIYKVCADESLMEETLKVAKKLAALPTIGLGLTKRALNKSITNDLTAQLALEDALQTAAGKTYDYNEGVAAFLEKRKPKFKGE